jgi:hypothetical protein
MDASNVIVPSHVRSSAIPLIDASRDDRLSSLVSVIESWSSPRYPVARHDQVEDLFARATLTQAVKHVVVNDDWGEGLPPEKEVLIARLYRRAVNDPRSQEEEDSIHMPPVRCVEV